jgi:hypothetical protein
MEGLNMPSEYRTYVTTTTSPLCDLFGDMFDAVGSGKIKSLKLLLENKLSKSRINTEVC